MSDKNSKESIVEELEGKAAVDVAVPDLSASNEDLDSENEFNVGGSDSFVVEEGLVEEGETIDPNAVVFAADEWSPDGDKEANPLAPEESVAILDAVSKADLNFDSLTPSAGTPVPGGEVKEQQKSLNATLDDTVHLLRKDQISDPLVLREQSIQNLISAITKAENVNDVHGFPAVLVSDDTIELAAKALLNSPKLEASDLVFVSADYNQDADQLDWSVGVPITRSGSVESLVFDPQTIFFDKTDEYKEYPRPDTPTRKPSKPSLKSSGLEIAEVVQNTDESEVKHDEGEIQEQQEVVTTEEKIDRDAVIQSILKNLEQKDKLSSKNIQLQNKLADYFKRKRTDESRDTEKSMADQEQRYVNIMNGLAELHDEAEVVKVTNKKVTSDYQQKLEERLAEVNEKAESFWKYKRSVALAAENSRTGKNLPEKVVEQLETTERKKENEVVAVRLENIKLRNKLRRQEQLLRQKEELADGLHLIDFEQLKIENQTYNEKIEERNEELLKLRKKITNVVQVLTHVKEKLQFIQAETVSLKSELKQLDEEVTSKRDSLPSLKNARDKLKSTNSLLRQQNGLLGNEKLLLDYGENVDEAKHLKEQIILLQDQHSKLVEESIMIRRRIQKTQLIAKLRGNPTNAGNALTI